MPICLQYFNNKLFIKSLTTPLASVLQYPFHWIFNRGFLWGWGGHVKLIPIMLYIYAIYMLSLYYNDYFFSPPSDKQHMECWQYMEFIAILYEFYRACFKISATPRTEFSLAMTSSLRRVFNLPSSFSYLSKQVKIFSKVITVSIMLLA